MKVRPELMHLMGITEKRLRDRCDRRGVTPQKQAKGAGVKLFTKQLRADAENLIRLAEEFEDGKNTEVDLQTINNKVGDVAGMALYIVRTLFHRTMNQ
jgi:hypothetical protein